MIRDRKVRLAFVVAMAAAAAAAAVLVVSAGAHTPAKFEFPKGGNTTIESTSDGTHVIDIPSWGPLECKQVSFSGTVSGASATSLTLEPAYSECQLMGEKAVVTMGSCDFFFGADGSFEITNHGLEACFKNDMQIETENNCKVYFRNQNKLTGIGYTNINSNEEITISMTITKLVGIRDNCEPAGQFKTGEYQSGNTILKGVQDDATKAKVPIKWVATVP